MDLTAAPFVGGQDCGFCRHYTWQLCKFWQHSFPTQIGQRILMQTKSRVFAINGCVVLHLLHGVKKVDKHWTAIKTRRISFPLNSWNPQALAECAGRHTWWYLHPSNASAKPAAVLRYRGGSPPKNQPTLEHKQLLQEVFGIPNSPG